MDGNPTSLGTEITHFGAIRDVFVLSKQRIARIRKRSNWEEYVGMRRYKDDSSQCTVIIPHALHGCHVWNLEKAYDVKMLKIASKEGFDKDWNEAM